MAIRKKTSEDILKRQNLTGINAAFATIKDLNEVIDVVDSITGGTTALTSLSVTGAITSALVTDSTSKDTGAVILEGGLGVEKAIFGGSTITAATQLRVSATSNQLRLGDISANDVIISSTAPAADSVYTIPDVGTTANFIMSAGTQTINGIKTFGSGIVTPVGAVGTPSLQVGYVDTGLYAVSTTQTGFSQDGALAQVYSAAGIQTAGLAELVALAGITYTGQDIKSAVTTLTALAGGAQAGTALTRTFNNFTVVATTGDSAQLPVAALGKKVIVKNSAAITMAVFGQTGDAIDGAAANASFLVYPGQEITFEALSGTTWSSKEGTSFGTISAVTQLTSITTGVTANSKKGTITTFTPSTAALSATTFTVTCNKATATANIRAWITEYGGTILTNGVPSVFVKNKTASGFDIVIYNAHATNALATSLVIGFEIIN